MCFIEHKLKVTCTLEHYHYVSMCKYNERLKSLFTIL